MTYSNKLEREIVLRDALATHQPETLLPELAMEFAQHGGKEPTLHEVLLHAALVGDSTRAVTT
jgi:hypothetical protein